MNGQNPPGWNLIPKPIERPLMKRENFPVQTPGYLTYSSLKDHLHIGVGQRLLQIGAANELGCGRWFRHTPGGFAGIFWAWI